MQEDPPGETIEAIWDRIECRRVAETVIKRMAAAWRDDRPVVDDRHADIGHDTVVTLGPCIPLAGTSTQNHGHFGAARDGDTVIVYGPCIPFDPP